MLPKIKPKTLVISRSKVDLFKQCPRCFYLDKKLFVRRTPFPPFSLNNTVDSLFKKEFDIYREKGKPHPLMEKYGIKAIPFSHPLLETWRNSFKGIRFSDKENDITLFGGIDDVWVNEKDELHIVDYKATSKDEEPTISASWQDIYKRQVEIYQFLFRKNGFTVSDTAYFVYTNAKTTSERFNDTLEFDTVVIPHEGSDAWIPQTLSDIRTCIGSDDIPQIGKSWNGSDCEYCMYREQSGKSFKDHVYKTKK